MAVTLEELQLRAKVGRALPSLSNFLTDSAARCYESAALPPFPMNMSLRPVERALTASSAIFTTF